MTIRQFTPGQRVRYVGRDVHGLSGPPILDSGMWVTVIGQSGTVVRVRRPGRKTDLLVYATDLEVPNARPA